MSNAHKTLLTGALILLAPFAALWAQDDSAPIRRTLGRMTLGDPLKKVQRLYPPARDWFTSPDWESKFLRLRLERADAKKFPEHAQVMWLGIRDGHLVEIQLLYDRAFTRKKATDSLAEEWALVYGEPRRSGDKFWWSDKKTVLRVFDMQVPVMRGTTSVVEVRTAIQIMDAGIFHRAS